MAIVEIAAGIWATAHGDELDQAHRFEIPRRERYLPEEGILERAARRGPPLGIPGTVAVAVDVEATPTSVEAP